MVMELGKGKLIRSKSQRNTQIKVATRWQYSESTPAFKRLMELLLRSNPKKAQEEGNDT